MGGDVTRMSHFSQWQESGAWYAKFYQAVWLILKLCMRRMKLKLCVGRMKLTRWSCDIKGPFLVAGHVKRKNIGQNENCIAEHEFVVIVLWF